MTEEVNPTDAFIGLFKMLVWTGFYENKNLSKYKYMSKLHQIYRAISITYVFIYNIQHLIHIFLVFDNKDQAFEGLLIEIPSFNMAVKTLTVILGAPTLEELNEAMANDPILAANSDKDNEILRRFRDVFKWMLNVCLVFITVTCCFWIVEMILTRMSNPTAAPPSFFPFDTDTTKGFVIALFLERGCVIWIAYGHISLDILFACYFYYAAVQLKIIRSNLEDFCKSEERPGFVMLNNRLRYQYLDEVDPTIYERFIFYVKRYEKVYWYLGEVGKLFNGAISIQFYTMSFCVCLVTYKLSTTPPLSITFLFYVTFLLVLQFQAFLFCFCGEIVKYESQCVVTSAYLSNWYLLSPRFRRNFFLATIRWSKPITPRVSKIIPLSLVTLVSITRAAFNLFTVLKTTNNK